MSKLKKKIKEMTADSLIFKKFEDRDQSVNIVRTEEDLKAVLYNILRFAKTSVYVYFNSEHEFKEHETLFFNYLKKLKNKSIKVKLYSKFYFPTIEIAGNKVSPEEVDKSFPGNFAVVVDDESVFIEHKENVSSPVIETTKQSFIKRLFLGNSKTYTSVELVNKKRMYGLWSANDYKLVGDVLRAIEKHLVSYSYVNKIIQELK